MSQDQQEFLDRVNRSRLEHEQKLEAFLATAPPSRPCPGHPEISLRLDQERTRAHFNGAAPRAVYGPCPACAEDLERQRMRDCGVPAVLAGATLDNWDPDGEQGEAILVEVRKFCTVRRGFLVLLGGFGTGKSHLAAGCMRHWRGGRFIAQSELLRWLRRSYGDRSEGDPVGSCQDASLFVLDDLGMSPGGRDELPLLHDIIAHRYGERRPTIITSNLPEDRFREIIGARAADRLREGLFALLTLNGSSKRWSRRQHYFEE